MENSSWGMSTMYDVDGVQHSPPYRHGLVANNVKPSYGSEGHADTGTSNCAHNSTETSDNMLMEGEPIEAREVRKSCDYCVMRKGKCDGNGTRTCSFCEKRGLMCIYGKKRTNGRHHSSAGNYYGDLGMLPHTGESVKRYAIGPGSKHPTMEPENLGRDSIPGVGSTVTGGDNCRFLEAFAVGSSRGEPNAVPGPTVVSGDLENPFGQIGVDGLLREDWEIAIGALLEDPITDSM